MSAAQIQQDFDAYDDAEVVLEGEVTRDLETAQSNENAFLVDDLLVLAPGAPERVPTGARVRLQGTVQEYEYQDPGAAEGEADPVLQEYDGRPALFATSYRPLDGGGGGGTTTESTTGGAQTEAQTDPGEDDAAPEPETESGDPAPTDRTQTD